MDLSYYKASLSQQQPKLKESNQETITNFEKEVDKLEKAYKEKTVKNLTLSSLKKTPNLSNQFSETGFTEISIKDLQIGKSHHGKFIKGTLCTRPRPMKASHSLMEDS
jgi:hypothetical protein